MIVKLHTSDMKWIEKNAIAYQVADNGNVTAHVEIGSNVERVTFASRDMIRFDLRSVAKRLPSDWSNANAMIPAAHIVSV